MPNLSLIAAKKEETDILKWNTTTPSKHMQEYWDV